MSHRDRLPGGLADERHPSDFNRKELARGVKVELEHTNDPEIAREIAMDHLEEDEAYYEKLDALERRSFRDMATLAENQTPEPNILGYLVLAAFGAAGLWAITRPRTAQAATLCPPATRERLGLYHSAFDVSVAWFPERATPPEAEVLADGRVRFPTARALIEGAPEPTPLAQPVVVVVGPNDQFYRYEGEPGQQVTPRLSADDRENYCALIRDAERVAT